MLGRRRRARGASGTSCPRSTCSSTCRTRPPSCASWRAGRGRAATCWSSPRTGTPTCGGCSGDRYVHLRPLEHVVHLDAAHAAAGVRARRARAGGDPHADLAVHAAHARRGAGGHRAADRWRGCRGRSRRARRGRAAAWTAGAGRAWSSGASRACRRDPPPPAGRGAGGGAALQAVDRARPRVVLGAARAREARARAGTAAVAPTSGWPTATTSRRPASCRCSRSCPRRRGGCPR